MATVKEKIKLTDSGENGTAEQILLEMAEVSSTNIFDQLRFLLIEKEQKQIEILDAKVADLEAKSNEAIKPEEISPILPQAIQQSAAQNSQLSEATLPLVEENIRLSTRRDPQILADALFPAIGPAIRRAIAEALSQMVQSLNKTLDNSFSLQGLKWRFEAWQTGKIFGEVVLLHTLLYRVEQVFLIHRETGLLLQHITANPADIHLTSDTTMRENAGLVSAMLTAIQDFVHDSFKTSPNGELNTLNYGDLTIWIEHAPHAILACVIRGNAPLELRKILQCAIEKIHLERYRELKNFKGDAAPFILSRQQLETCLQVQLEQEKPESEKRRLLPLQIIGTFALLLILLAGFFWIRDYWRWTQLLQNLRAEKGIVLTETGRGWFSHSISGLRDPLSKEPSDIVKLSGYNENALQTHWEIYQALNPDFITQRAQLLLNPPASVNLKFTDGVLSATGTAPANWRTQAENLARGLAGVNKFDASRINEEDVPGLIEKIQNSDILSNCGTTDFAAGQTEKLRLLHENFIKLKDAAKISGSSLTATFTGFASSNGASDFNSEISRRRAEKLLGFVFATAPAAVFKDETLNASAIGQTNSNQTNTEISDSCKVTIKIEITSTPKTIE